MNASHYFEYFRHTIEAVSSEIVGVVGSSGGWGYLHVHHKGRERGNAHEGEEGDNKEQQSSASVGARPAAP